MPLYVDCPHCEARLQISNRSRLDHPIRCPRCQREFQEDAGQAAKETLVTTPVVDSDGDANSDLDLFEKSSVENAGHAETPDHLFYKIDSTRMSYTEYWWGSPWNPLVLVAWLIRLLRIPVPSSTDDPPVKSLTPFRVSLDDVPDDVRQEFGKLIGELKECGFQDPVYHAIHDGYHKSTIHWVSLRHESGRALVRCQRRYWTGSVPAKKYLFPTFVSVFDDETYLASTSGKADMLWPDEVDLHRNRKAGASALWNQHCDALTQSSFNKQLMPIRDREELVEMLEKYHQLFSEFHIARGAFGELADAEQARACSAAPEGSSVSQDSEKFAYADVYEEIQKQQNKKQSWLNAVLLLGISMILFLGLGAFAWSFEFVLMLIPVLLFHETGHYVAMKLSGYQNLKMFFIPLFGAAVSGQHLNVPAWKKVVVSLAGPVPGIVLGIGFGIYGLIHEIEWLVQLSMLSLVLNGINLLPVLPLDGGWIVHTLFFSRHYALDGAFRVLTGLSLLSASAFIGDKFLMGLGIFILIGIPAALKVGRIAHRLKPTMGPMLANEESLSKETVNVISHQIEQKFTTQPLNTKMRALLARNVFDLIKSPAPGWLATITLAGVHVGSVLVSVVFLAVLIIAQHAGGLNQFLDVMAAAPVTPYKCGSIQSWNGKESSPAGKQITIIAECANAEDANQIFVKLAGQLPPKAAFRVFGQTLLLALPVDDNAGRKKMLSGLESHCEKVVVHSDDYIVPLTLTCIAVSAESAEQIEQAFNSYALSIWQFPSLVSPWSPDHPLTAKQKRARKTLQLLTKYDEPEEDGRLIELRKKQVEAVRHGDRETMTTLKKEIAAIYRDRQDKHIQSVRDRDDVDQQLIKIYVRRPTHPEPKFDEETGTVEYDDKSPEYLAFLKASKTWRREISARLGLLPLTKGEPSPGAKRYGLTNGGASRAGFLLRFDNLTFHRHVDGIPTFVDWLCSQKCIDFKYRLASWEDMLEDGQL